MMIKKISMLALAGLIALPAVASASAGKAPTDLTNKIDDLARQLDALKAQLAQQNETIAGQGDKLGDMEDMLDEKSEAWDLAARFKFYGDLRTRFDYNHTHVPEYYGSLNVARAMRGFGVDASTPASGIAQAMAGFKMMSQGMAQQYGISAAAARRMMLGMYGINATAPHQLTNETMFSNRFRLNMRVKATENVEAKVRLVGNKVWGMQSSVTPENGDLDSPFFLNGRSFDGTSGRQTGDSSLLIDRAFINWNNIGGAPVWFSIGRRPTTDGPPAHLRMGTDKRMATPVSYMDYPFDGISMGYAYSWGNEDLGTGRIRFCYGRGFEAGLSTDGQDHLNDVDFGGISWDIMKKGNRFMNFQSFGAFNIFNIPGDTYYPNPIELAEAESNPNYRGDTVLDRKNMGDIYHTSLVYMDKIQNLNYFGTLGWSHTVARGMDEIGASLLGSWGAEPEDKDGYGIYAGVRYDMDDIGLKLGAEFNWGSENWLAFTPGHDDMYASKLYTRGKVYEAYMVYDLPTGEAISKYAKTFIRLGVQFYDYDYSYSGMWLGTPVKIEELNDPINAQFYAPIDDMRQVYLTFEAYF